MFSVQWGWEWVRSCSVVMTLVFSQFTPCPIFGPNVLFGIACIPDSGWLSSKMSCAKARSSNLFWPNVLQKLLSSISLVDNFNFNLTRHWEQLANRGGQTRWRSFPTIGDCRTSIFSGYITFAVTYVPITRNYREGWWCFR